jgi:hypothetical protein
MATCQTVAIITRTSARRQTDPQRGAGWEYSSTETRKPTFSRMCTQLRWARGGTHIVPTKSGIAQREHAHNPIRVRHPLVRVRYTPTPAVVRRPVGREEGYVWARGG